MRTITIRDLRQHWPEAEKLPQVDEEIIITRDGEPVAKLVRVGHEKAKRKRWNPKEHMRWLKKVWRGKVMASGDTALSRARADRCE